MASSLDTGELVGGIRIRCELSAPPPMVRADALQIEQVLRNLVDNGLAAMAADGTGGELVIQTAIAAKDTVTISVRDSGRGVSPDVAARLFEPFFTTKPDGMGMGLSICKSIVEAHDGRLWAENNPGRGATFRFTLPAQAGDHAHANRTDRVRSG